MENSSSYFENRECRYYPCHDMKEINCLFCYCPLYFLDSCPGNYSILHKDGKKIKTCMECRFPHEPENYGKIIKLLKEAINKGNPT